jgi:uncharacterized protein (DUF885 family)
MNPRLGKLIDEVLAFLWEASPSSATAFGIHDHDSRLADYSPAAIAARARRLAEFGAELERLPGGGEGLADHEVLDARVLRSLLEVEERMHRETRLPFRDPCVYLDEILYGVYYLVQREFAPLPERAGLAARRLLEVPRLLDQGKANLSDPREVPPAWIGSALQLIGGSRVFFGDLDRSLAPRAGAAGPDLGRAIKVAARAVEGFERDLRDRVAPMAAGDFAIGRDLFEFLVRVQHGIDLDADGLHEFGSDLIRTTGERLEEAVLSIDRSRPWQDLVGEWKGDHPGTETFVEEYRREVERARDFVLKHGLATLPPGERLRVVETPPFQRTICPFAAYVPPGPFETSQEGFLWVTPPEDGAPPEVRERVLRDHPRPAMAATVAHEAYPGHHLQLSAASRIASTVRRFYTTPVFVEGWAFYCEQLMAEEGFYIDPRSRVLQLKDQLWRACRVVIDVGIHTRGMSLDAAAAMLHEVARIEVPSARGEVLRYSRSPTQPMSYAVGKREILRLRDGCRRKQGAAFRLQRFHDDLLGFGSIPIALIRGRMLEEAPAA